jgi:hypothetical protein
MPENGSSGNHEGPPPGGLFVVSRWDIHPCDDRLYLLDKWWWGNGPMTYATRDEQGHILPDQTDSAAQRASEASSEDQQGRRHP